jgi:putative ABC transport system permease protein
MLTLRRFPLRNAVYHWRANLPVLLGVAVGAAVLTGALLVGDSLRGSLRDRAIQQLNGVEAAYLGQRMIREAIAEPLGVVPGLSLQGSLSSALASGERHRVSRGSILGLTAAGARAFALPEVIDWDGESAVAVLSERVARHLHVAVGEAIVLGVEKRSRVPRASLLGRRNIDDVTATIRVTVGAILPADHGMNLFSLVPNPTPPENVFVPLHFLQSRVEPSKEAAEPVLAVLGSGAYPFWDDAHPSRINSLFARSGSVADLNSRLAAQLQLSDWGLRVVAVKSPVAYLSVESEQLLLDGMAVRAVESTARAREMRFEPTVVYLANAISPGEQPLWTQDSGEGRKFIAYSTIAGLNPNASAPLGPFLPPGVSTLADDEIVLADWPESPLRGLPPGEILTVTYFRPEMEATLEETSAQFRLKGYVPLTGPAADPHLTPPFPGVTDKLSISDWEAPFEINLRRIKPRDEEYWQRYRATPKAYMSLRRAEELFGSRFGTVTSVRVAPPARQSLAEAAGSFRQQLLRELDPAAAGIQFENTRDRLLAASRGGTDFGMLFLGFSLFLILSALLLVSLLFRLALDRRAREVGLLLATGYSPGQVRRLLWREGGLVAAVGSLLGLVAAIGFARLMVAVLVDLWPNPEVGQFLRLHVTGISLVIGYLATVLMAVLTIAVTVRGLVRVPMPLLLRGEATPANVITARPQSSWLSVLIASGCAIIAVIVLSAGKSQANADVRAGAFFGGGLLFLISGLMLARCWLNRNRVGMIQSRGLTAILRLGIRNAARNPSRSLLTATLIASATFLLVAVESFRRHPDRDFLQPGGGSGGYRLLAEADVPIFQRFDRDAGRDDLLERLQAAFQQSEASQSGGLSLPERLQEAEASLKKLQVVPFRLQGGDDASCLNLYQAGRPRVLGVPEELLDRGGFRFAQSLATTESERRNPWQLLLQPQEDGAIPVIVEQNTAMWMLKTPVGGILTQPDGDGRPVRLRIVGTLQDSVFQSEILMSDGDFRRLYPRQEGFRLFLIDTVDEDPSVVAGLLETGFAANGMTVSSTLSRVAAYQAVIGTYLTTFQLLGGFGLLLGVFGLGVLLLRAVWERIGELALLRAVGYRSRTLQGILLAENLLVLIIGLGVGLLAAAASVIPNLALGGTIPGIRLAGMLGLVFVTGCVVTVGAAGSLARVPLIPALRND